MSSVGSSYASYEKQFKRELYKLAFIVSALLCAIYFFRNIERGDTLDAVSNATVVILSILGLVYMRHSDNIGRIHYVPAFNYMVLFIGSFAGSPSSPDAASLFWCLLFLPCLVLTLGHIKSLPYILLIQAFTYFSFFMSEPTWMYVEYSSDEKQTYMVTSTILLILVWFSEYVRFKLSRGLYFENIEKKRMKYLSSHDELTGLFNRRGFKEQIESKRFFNKRNVDQTAIILIDIDDFKHINDTHGHSFGDIVLKNIARLQLATVRSTDTVVRWGGEEFLILLSNVEAAQVKRIAENIRKNIEKTPVANEEIAINITVSIGIAFSREVSSIEELVELADNRLYAAKGHGKNCIFAECSPG
ncbi:GGDEF domain-containing protein [Thalassotalea euphylliae]|uniref:GGDEF domain-containing protein n=1 Tax=Thalassotalea euphylliae TaxID=1655234 RepID=UPI00363F3D7B